MQSESSQKSFSAQFQKPPVKPKNSDVRAREYLTDSELDALLAAARKTGRHGFRDHTLILLAYRHGLRVGELVNLKWEQVDLAGGVLHVNRLKKGDGSVQPK